MNRVTRFRESVSPFDLNLCKQGGCRATIAFKRHLNFHIRNNNMGNTFADRKLMTIGEGGSALAFAALAMFSIIVAAGAFTPEFAFHAYLFAAASIAAVFAIINRYYERPNEEAPLIIR